MTYPTAFIISLFLLIAVVAVAHSQMLLIGGGGPVAAGSGGGGGCSNTLDFSVACNSQYIPVVLR
jgi:hypothetical protein